MVAQEPSLAFACPHGERCGGCAFLGLPYGIELERKAELVRAAFAPYPEHAQLALESVGAAEPTIGYRVRAKLVRDRTGALGLYARDSHDVVDIPECRVLAPELAQVAAAARAALDAAPVEAVDLRLVDRGVLVTLIAPSGTREPTLLGAARALVAEAPNVIGVAASFRAPNSVAVLGTRHVVLLGNDVEPHHLSPAEPYHLATHGAFVQAHPGQATRAYGAIARALIQRGARRVLELYAGSGALALRLARAGLEVTAVEAFEPAVMHAARAAREQGLTLTTLCAPAERATREFAQKNQAFDAIIVNPPRRGLSPQVRMAIAELAPQSLVYMSCDARTLARDLSHFRELGFTSEAVAPFDMIPHSDAVECLVVLERGPAPQLCLVHESDELLVVARSAYLPMVQLTSRVRSLPGARDAEPLFGTEFEHSGLVPFARSRARLAELGTRVEPTFVGLARGITHKKGRIRRPITRGSRGASRVTNYERLGVRGGHSLVRITPDTADEQQVRRHFAAIGHPLLGDGRSGDRASNTFFEHKYGLDRLFLHCTELRGSLALGPLELPGDLSNVLASCSDQTTTSGE